MSNGKTKTLYVAGLDTTITDSVLRAEFEKFATIERVTIIKDKISRESKGFAYVVVGSFEDAPVALKEMDGRVIADKPIKVKFSFSEAPEWQAILDGRRNGTNPMDRGGYRGRGGFAPRSRTPRGRGGYQNSGYPQRESYDGQERSRGGPPRGFRERGGRGMSRGGREDHRGFRDDVSGRPSRGFGEDRRGGPPPSRGYGDEDRVRSSAPSYREREPMGSDPRLNAERGSSSDYIRRRGDPLARVHPSALKSNDPYSPISRERPVDRARPSEEYGRVPTKDSYSGALSSERYEYPERRSSLPSSEIYRSVGVENSLYGRGEYSDRGSRGGYERRPETRDPYAQRQEDDKLPVRRDIPYRELLSAAERPRESRPLYARESRGEDNLGSRPDPRRESYDDPRRDAYATRPADAYSARPAARETYDPVIRRQPPPRETGGYVGYGSDNKEEQRAPSYSRPVESVYSVRDY